MQTSNEPRVPVRASFRGTHCAIVALDLETGSSLHGAQTFGPDLDYGLDYLSKFSLYEWSRNSVIGIIGDNDSSTIRVLEYSNTHDYYSNTG